MALRLSYESSVVHHVSSPDAAGLSPAFITQELPGASPQHTPHRGHQPITANPEGGSDGEERGMEGEMMREGEMGRREGELESWREGEMGSDR